MRKSYRVKKEAEFQTVLRRVNHVRTANLSFTCLKSRAGSFSGRHLSWEKDWECRCTKLGQTPDSANINGS